MPRERPLSERQQAILQVVRQGIQEHGYAPTVREICRQVSLSSTTTVHRHLETLARRGYIRREANRSRLFLTEQARGLVLAGRIAAGRPIEAVEQSERIDLGKLFDSHDHFLLEVTGDSMIEDQIADGDLVVIRKQETCRNGEIVVALLEGDEATLKRFYRERNRIRLQPANSRLKPIYCKQVRVLGVLAGVIRRTR